MNGSSLSMNIYEYAGSSYAMHYVYLCRLKSNFPTKERMNHSQIQSGPFSYFIL